MAGEFRGGGGGGMEFGAAERAEINEISHSGNIQSDALWKHDCLQAHSPKEVGYVGQC